MKKYLQTDRGFSLIELLVVIAIITLVIVILFPNFNLARQRARDNARKGDLSQIQKTLELYKLDQATPAYPAPTYLSVCNKCWSSLGACPGTAGDNIYIRKIPCDPASTGPTPTTYLYTRDSDITKYTLTACLENAADPDRDSPVASFCSSTSGVSYTIHEQ